MPLDEHMTRIDADAEQRGIQPLNQRAQLGKIGAIGAIITQRGHRLNGNLHAVFTRKLAH